MCTVCETTQVKAITFKGKVLEEDQQQKDFEELLKLWVDNKISYETMMKGYPDYDITMFEKICRLIKKTFNL